MNKAYRHVYKDGIGWVAIAENGSCVSSSKGSGTVSAKTKVEVLKNFFDLRNSVVLNNGFLLKGLFAATLFCGVFVGDLKAAPSKQEIEGLQEIAKIQNNGTTVYTGNDGYRMEKVVNPDGSIGFKGRFDKSIIDRIDSNGVVEIGGRHFVIPTGSLLKDKSQLTEKDFIFFEVVKDGNGNWRGKTFGEYKAEGKFDPLLNLDREVVQYDAQEKKWYMHNHAETSPLIKEGRKLYYGKKENGEFGFATWNYLAGIPTTNPKDKDGIGNPEMIDGYYKIKSETVFAKVEFPLGTKIGDEFMLSKPERLSLVGKDGINTTPQIYKQADKTNGKIPNGRKVGDNKDGNIRLGNVARAIYDDEAVNLGQLNEKLENSKTHYVSIKSSTNKNNYNNDGATGENSIAIGPNAEVNASRSVAIGPNAKAYNIDSVAIGVDAKATGEQSTSLGHNAEANNTGSTAIGHGAKAFGEDSYALGSQSEAQKDYAIAIGFGAEANAEDSLALGSGAKTEVEGSVALGSGSVAAVGAGEEGKYFGVGENAKKDTATWTSTSGAVSVGRAEGTKDRRGRLLPTITRQITNLAAGTKDTDAVNVAQLKTGLNSKADKDATNLEAGDVTKWQEKLKINEKADKTEIKTLAKGSVEVKAADGQDIVEVAKKATTDKDTYTVSVNADKLAKNNTFITSLGDNFAKKDASNIDADNANAWKDKLGIKNLNASKLFTAKADKVGSTGIEIGANDTLNFLSGDNLIASSDANGIKYGLSKTLTGITSIAGDTNKPLTITAGDNKKYTFGDKTDTTNNVITGSDLTTKLNNYVTTGNDKTDTTNNVITGSDLTTKLNNYVTTGNDKTASVSVVADSGLKLESTTTTGSVTNYELNLDKDKIQDIAGTTKLAADLTKKADLDAGNLEDADVTSWQTKLGIDKKADKSDLENLANKDLSNITNDGKTTIKNLAKGSVEVVGDNDLVTVTKTVTTDKDTYKVSVDATKLASNDAFSDKFAKKDASNIVKDKWEKALGLGDYVKSVTSKDDFIKVDNTNKQTPVLSLDTEKLAGDKTFVTNIAENNNFTTKLGETFVTKTNLTDITNKTNIIGGNDNKLIDENGKLTEEGKKALTTNAASGQNVIKNKNIIQAINNINKQGTRFFHVNNGTEPMGTKEGEDKEDSSAGSKGGVAIGIQAKVDNDAENAISMGTKSQVSVAGGVALGSYSQANRKALDDTTKKGVYLFDNQAVADTVANTKGAISVGGSDEVGNKFTRQITGVAAGTEDSDAVNVAQLKAVQKVVNQGSKWISANPVSSVQEPKSTGKDSLAIGAGAMATGNNSVALGSGSITVSANGVSRDNTVSVGAPGKERTISNVAPGVLDSDAATMGQLRAGLNDVYGKLGEYKKDASAGTASALAVGNLPQATIPGKGMISLGSGFYDGQSAMAIGLSKMSDSGKWVFKGSASYDSQEKAGAALSVGFHF